VSVEKVVENSDAVPVIIKNKNLEITVEYFVRIAAFLDENKHSIIGQVLYLNEMVKQQTISLFSVKFGEKNFIYREVFRLNE
jgi:hypothetical protein